MPFLYLFVAKSPCSRHDLRTLILQTLFARCFRRLSWPTFACRYHTLCSLADFTCFFSHTILPRCSHLPFPNIFSHAMCAFPFLKVLGKHTIYFCQNPPNATEKLIRVIHIALARYFQTLRSHFMFAFHSRMLWLHASHNSFALCFYMLSSHARTLQTLSAVLRSCFAIIFDANNLH